MKQELIKWANRITGEVAKHSPTILTVVAVGGIGATAYFTAKATLQAKEKLEEMKEEELTTKEKAKKILPIYIPAFTAFLATSACVVGAHTIDTKRQMALVSAYSLSTEALKDVEEKFKETYGEKKLDKLHSEINKDKAVRIHEMNKDHVIETGRGNQLFIDGFSGQIYKSSMDHVNRVYNNINETLNNGESVTVNEINDRLGIRPVQMGDYWIFDVNRTGIIDLDKDPEWTDETQTETCTYINYRNKPVLSYCERDEERYYR